MHILRQVLLQYSQGVSQRQICRNLPISRETLRGYLAQLACSEWDLSSLLNEDDSVLSEVLIPPSKGPPNPKLKVLEGYFPDYVQELKSTGVTRACLWQEYRARHVEGFGYSQFCQHFRNWLGCQDIPMVLSHEPGEFIEIDFAGKKFRYRDFYSGVEVEMEVFVASFPSSGYTFACACENQQLSSVLSALQDALDWFGGSPKAVRPDNMKTAVTQSDTYEPIINQSFMECASHYGMAVVPARALKPRDKPVVENNVEQIYRRIYAPLRNRTFHNLSDVNQAFREQLDLHNAKPLQGASFSRKNRFEAHEQALLASLPETRYELRKFTRLKVWKNSHVRLGEDKHFYSVPHRFIGKRLKVAYSESSVEIYHQTTRVAFHRRKNEPLGYSTIKEHMPSAHQAFDKIWNPDFFLEQAQKTGQTFHQLIQTIFERAIVPEQAYKSCMGLINLARKYSSKRVNDAAQRALDYDRPSYRTLRNILEKGLDQISEPQPATRPCLLENEHVRGADYYQQFLN